MNKFGIKVYADGIYNIDGVRYIVNSIKYHYSGYDKSTSIFRFINFNSFGIELIIYKK